MTIEFLLAKLIEPALFDCPECAAVFAGTRTCPECGYYLAPKGRLIETLDRELVEVGVGPAAEQLDELAFYLELRAIALERGWKQGAAAHRFKQRIGRFPPWAWNAMPIAAPTLSTRRWLTSRNIARRKAKEAATREAR